MKDKMMPIEKKKRRRGRKYDEGEHINKKNLEHNSGSFGYKPHHTSLIKIGEEVSQKWYDWGSDLPGRNDSSLGVNAPLTKAEEKGLAQKYRSLADEILRVELSLGGARSTGSRGGDERWVENTMKKGTLKDRIAATSVLVSSDPIHKLFALENLLSMAGCSESGQTNSRIALMAAEALEDLFLNTLLPPGRKLLTLEQRPLASYDQLLSKTLSPRVLLLWRFEEILKGKYQSFLSGYLAVTLRDGMDLNKTLALRTAGAMLRSTPEGEAQLLTMMVNKLGDPGKKIASSASHELRRVLDEHENMQEIIAREVQQLAHRPHLSTRALYNCIVFLNQLKLRKESSPDESSKSFAVSLVNTYFLMFDVAMKKQSDRKADMKSRLLSALLTGINRARPFLPDKDQELNDHMDSLYNISHVAAPSAGTQALMLLFHVVARQPGESQLNETNAEKQDRFYRALYAKLSSSSCVGGGKHLTMFFNLLYKAIKYDQDQKRVLALTKRLLCTVMHLNQSVAAGSLFLVSEVMKTQKQIADSLNDLPDHESAYLVLDSSKREPRAAIVNLTKRESRAHDVSSPLWDVCLFARHFHPSVAKFAASLGGIQYSGDPLRDFALGPFLDKFSYKNPKARKKARVSIAERRIETQSVRPLNDPSFLKEGNISESDAFFHKFFVDRALRQNNKISTRVADHDEESESGSFDLIEEHHLSGMFEDDVSTDSEERAFVDNLSKDLLDEGSSFDGANLDDEDPDIDFLDDINDDMNKEGNTSDSSLEDCGRDDETDSTADEAKLADRDDFMDDSHSDDDYISLLGDDDDADNCLQSNPRHFKSGKKEKNVKEKHVLAHDSDDADLIRTGFGRNSKRAGRGARARVPSASKRQKT